MKTYRVALLVLLVSPIAALTLAGVSPVRSARAQGGLQLNEEPRSDWGRHVRATAHTAYNPFAVYASMRSDEEAAMTYWNQLADSYDFGRYDTTSVSWNGWSDTRDFDVLFDAVPEGIIPCWYDSTHCEDFEGNGTIANFAAYTSSFPDLNLRVVTWNASSYDRYPNPSPICSGSVCAPFYEVIMRHELGHDKFLAHNDTCGNLMAPYADPSGQHANCMGPEPTPAELAVAQQEFEGRAQPPTNVWVDGWTADSVTLSWSGVSGADAMNVGKNPAGAYVGDKNYWGWSGRLPPDTTTYTLSGLSPGMNYHFEVGAERLFGGDPDQQTHNTSFQIEWTPSAGLRAAGAPSVQRIVQAMEDGFNATHPGADLQAAASSSTSGIKALLNNQIEYALSDRAPVASDQNGTEFGINDLDVWIIGYADQAKTQPLYVLTLKPSVDPDYR